MSRFGERLKLWWEGYRIEEVTREPEEPLLLTELAEPEPPPPDPEELAKRWPRLRIEAAEIIFGRDCVRPGGTEFTVTLAKPLNLNPAVTLLEMAAGLGGSTRALVQTFGIWVTGLETDPDLAQEANTRSRQADLEKKAPVRGFSLDNFELKAQSFDCVLAREIFFEARDKPKLYAQLHKGLKDRGQLLFTDFVIEGAGAAGAGDAVAKWLAIEDVPGAPWAAREVLRSLEALRFDVRIADDASESYRGHVMVAFANLVAALESKTVAKAVLPYVLGEAERWAALLKAIDEGGLRLYRYHAFKK